MYKSTRGNKLYSSSEAILKGLADDGGLFVPNKIESINFNKSWLRYDYKDIAFTILRHFLDDYTNEEIIYVVNKAYSSTNFIDKIYDTKSFNGHSYLELFHGPTLAFKDMALTILPHLMEVANKKINYAEKITILTATSGDTGGAALSGFKNSKNINIVVLYPNNGVSSFQQQQMLSFTNEKAKAFCLDNNFDECQSIVKELFLNNKSDVKLSSANSINIGRLIPQIVYYFQGYIDMVKSNQINFGDKINVCVPTGNFGNILASYIAKMIGLPINDFICASNENNVLTDFFNTGVYSIKREFYKTNSPSMDILISSNLERLLYLICMDESKINSLMNDLKNNKEYKLDKDLYDKLSCFKAYHANQQETLDTIKKVYENDGYLIDPHTAVARCCYEKYGASQFKTLIVSTASPFKFSESIIKALNIESSDNNISSISNYCNYPITENINRILNCKKSKILMTKDEICKYLFNPKYNITIPATTANLGSGFDCLGMSLNILNKYQFYLSNEYKCLNFSEGFNNPNNNLIIKSYQYVFNKLNLKDIPITVLELEKNIPSSGGLGTSAVCIIAGMMMAKKVLNLKEKDILKLMIEFEGHPDNIIPAYYGGLVGTYKENDEYKFIKYPINNKLKFIIYYPDFFVKTSEARKALPNSLNYSDVIYNLSRIVHVPKAFNDGDINLLKDVLKDKLHEPFRYPLIKDGKLISDTINKDKSSICVISGSGASLLVITTNLNVIDKISKLNLDGWKHIICKPYDKKVRIK